MKMMKHLMVLLTLLCSGCALLVVGSATAVGTYVYVEGQLQRTYNANLEHTYQATLAGCTALGLPIQDTDINLSSASVTTKDGDRDVWIKLEGKSSRTTEVSVRAGLLGDEVAARRIHEAIRSSL